MEGPATVNERRCHDIKSPPETDLPLAEIMSPPGDSVSEQSLSHRNRISPSTIQSLPLLKNRPLSIFRLLSYIILNEI